MKTELAVPIVISKSDVKGHHLNDLGVPNANQSAEKYGANEAARLLAMLTINQMENQYEAADHDTAEESDGLEDEIVSPVG